MTFRRRPFAPPKPAAAKAAPPPPRRRQPAPPAPAPAASNSQDDIDAMLAGLDEATSEAEIRPPQPDGRGVRTDRRDGGAGTAARRQPAFQKVEPDDDLEFAESRAPGGASAARVRAAAL